MPQVGDYWRSLESRAGADEAQRFVEGEFPEPAEALLEPGSRRTFLKLMGASIALGGATACRWPAQEILPFTAQPEGTLPGVPQYYATALELGGVASALLVKSFDGRPIKVEGNPLHPQSRGAASARSQASVLELYDPARSREIVSREDGSRSVRDAAWLAAELQAIGAEARARRGAGLHVLAEASGSPTLRALRERMLAELPGMSWHIWEPLSRDRERDGSRQAFGRPHRTQWHFDRAEVVVSFDEDFLFEHPDAVRQARDWADSRRPESRLDARLWVFEPGYSTTGAMADHRVALATRMIPVAVGCLAAELFLDQRLPLPLDSPELVRVLERYQYHPLYTEMDWTFARQLAVRRGRSLVVCGPRQPPEVHALVQLINAGLGNFGETVRHTEDPEPRRPNHAADLAALGAALEAGFVDTLLVLGGNPVYDAPADLALAQRLGRARRTLHLALYEDETSETTTIHVPRAHPLESWGDARDWRGTYSPCQPLIAPLYDGWTPAELLTAVLDGERGGPRELVRRTFEALFGADPAESRFRQALHDGVVEGSAFPERQPGLEPGPWIDALKEHLRTRAEWRPEQLELTFVPSAAMHDGRFANNGWLQELPDPVTKLTWDNAALLGPATAGALEVKKGDRLELQSSTGTLVLPAFVVPGMAPGVVAVPLGYGRRKAGSDGSGVGVGVDAYPLRTMAGLDRVRVSARKLSGSHDLATTQDHWAIDALGARERDERVPILVREISLAEAHAGNAVGGAPGPDVIDEPELAEHGLPAPDPSTPGEPERLSGHEPTGHANPAGHTDPAESERHLAATQLWEDPARYEGYRWGMAIDLNACTGCNACVTACQAENNVPVVGKREVARGREMHWIRVDRYFGGAPERPELVFQPMTCQHCENAPCEQVCPVGATLHDHEGLNVMVYNRCIGTRYCLNNCPYKVRRFNWFNNHKHESALELMIYNPEVTMRSRGVMEKCTFCVQRIQAAKIAAKNDGRRIRDGEFTTACAQACPTRAIAFGDLNDPASEVAARHRDGRSYAMLEEWNVQPRNRYLARVRNRDPRGAPDEPRG